MKARLRGEPLLHAARVVWSAAPFRRDPVDVLRRVLDVACFAVHAVLRIDLEPRIAFVSPDDFVHTGRAIARLGATGALPVQRDRQLWVGKLQMARLVLLMIGVADEYRRQPVEGKHAIGSRIVDLLRGRRIQQCFVVWMRMVEGPRRLAAEYVGIEGGIGQAAPQAELRERRPDISDKAKFTPT